MEPSVFLESYIGLSYMESSGIMFSKKAMGFYEIRILCSGKHLAAGWENLAAPKASRELQAVSNT